MSKVRSPSFRSETELYLKCSHTVFYLVFLAIVLGSSHTTTIFLHATSIAKGKPARNVVSDFMLRVWD